MRKCLVTGASGFIGNALCRQLRMEKYIVRAGLHKHIGLPRQWHESVELELTSNNWEENPCQGVDTVFHLAGKAHALTETNQDEQEYRVINSEGTRKLLGAAKEAGVERFIYFSSIKAVGEDGRLQLDESSRIKPETHYGQSKLEAEQLVLHGGYVPHSVVIRPCMVYGNSNKGNLPRMIKAIRKGIFPPLPENHNKRSMVHVGDVVQAAILAAEKNQAAGQIYIVSDGQAYSTRQIFDWIRGELGKSAFAFSIPTILLQLLASIGDMIGRVTNRRFIFDTDALHKLTGSAWYSSDKIVNELGFIPKYSLKESLPEIIQYLN